MVKKCQKCKHNLWKLPKCIPLFLSGSLSTISIVIISITIITLLTSILTIYYCYVKRREEKDTNLKGDITLERQTSTIKEGVPSKINEDTFLNEQSNDPMVDLCDRKFPQSTIKAWKDVTIERELGSGQFGKVYKGFLNSNYTR